LSPGTVSPEKGRKRQQSVENTSAQVVVATVAYGIVGVPGVEQHWFLYFLLFGHAGVGPLRF
jgi:hypothetical protein